jgi:hypothetical protein
MKLVVYHSCYSQHWDHGPEPCSKQIVFLPCFITSCIVTGVAINRLPGERILPYVIRIRMASELIVQWNWLEGINRQRWRRRKRGRNVYGTSLTKLVDSVERALVLRPDDLYITATATEVRMNGCLNQGLCCLMFCDSNRVAIQNVHVRKQLYIPSA